ncbi:9396_t:CDS:2, partial [Dentiscutata heterogama]
LSNYQPEVIVLSDSDNESIAVKKTEPFISEEVSKNKSGRISVTRSNNRFIQRQLSILLYESNSTDKSGSVFEVSSYSKSLVVNDSFEDKLAILNNSLKNNIVNSSFETNNESNLFASDLDQNKVIDKCFTVLSNSSMTSYCSFFHKTDTQIVKGKIINKGSCSVKFYHIVPNDLTECPFIIMIFVGIHNHSSLPAIKTLQNIIENLQKIINNEYDLDLTARKLLTTELSLVFTKMNNDTWNQTPNNTNANKSAHANINLDGQSLSFLVAIY